VKKLCKEFGALQQEVALFIKLIRASRCSQKLEVPSVWFPFVSWARIWKIHYTSLLSLIAVNTVITAFNEFASRSLQSIFMNDANLQISFFVTQGSSYAVNRQSTVSIVTTLVTSTFGGVVFFINRRFARFLFFLIFGCFASFVGQIFGHLVRDQVLSFSISRFWFDLSYLVTIKYTIFEFGRGAIRSSFGKPIALGWFRFTQDFLTTALRVLALNILGFKG
jgi:hypothetical protein